MENLFRFLKFLLIPIRVPLGTVSLVTYGPLAIGIGVTAITVGTATFYQFGKSAQQIRDPDVEALISATIGGLKFLAAVANPFDELQNIKNNDFSAIGGFSTSDQDQIKDFITSYSDEISSDEFKTNIEKAQQEIKSKFPDGIPDNIKPEVTQGNEEAIQQKLQEVNASPEVIQNIQNLAQSEKQISQKRTAIDTDLKHASPGTSPTQNLSAEQKLLTQENTPPIAVH